MKLKLTTLALLLASFGAQAQSIIQVPGIPTTSTQTATSGIPYSVHLYTNVNPQSASTAVYPGLWVDSDYLSTASAISGGGHVFGVLGHGVTHSGTTLPLLIGTEGKIDNFAAGTVTTAVSVDNNVGSNSGTISSWIGSYSHIAANAGTITTAQGFSFGIDSAAANSVGTLYTFIVPTLATPSAISGTMFGFFFNSNTGVASRYAIYVNDSGAPIKTLGQVQTNTLQLDSGTKTATATAGAATLNKASGKITTESLTTAGLATYTLTITNSQIAAADTVFASIALGTNSAGQPHIETVTPAAGSVVIVIRNLAAAAAFNGTLVVSFISMKA